jgi:hypothetical protein
MLTQEAELARRGPGGIEIRREPVRLRWEWENLTTSDGYPVRLTFDASLRTLDTPTERAMLEESLLRGRNLATTRDVVEHFTPALRSAAARSLSEMTAQAALAESSWSGIIEKLSQAARVVAFGAGLEIQPPITLDIDSPTLRQEQAAALEARRADERSARQISQLRRSAELYKEFQSLRQTSSDLTPGQILATFAETDQADMLAALLAAESAAKPSSLWLVAGPGLWKITGAPSPSGPTMTLPETLGPLRSISAGAIDGRRVLLAGASRGVWVIEPARSKSIEPVATAPPVPFEMPGLNSAMGFNSAQIADGRLWASHSQAGLVAWELNRPQAPAVVFADLIEAQAPRRLHTCGDRVLFSAGGNVCIIDSAGQLKISPIDSSNGRPVSPILGLIPAEYWCALVGTDGQIRRLDRETLAPIAPPQQRCGSISAAARMPWMDSSRLLLATEDGPVWCVGFDDALVTQYISPYRGLRILAASPGRIAAVTSDRQRLIEWNTWDGTRVVSDIHVASVARHRIADIAFVAESA